MPQTIHGLVRKPHICIPSPPPPPLAITNNFLLDTYIVVLLINPYMYQHAYDSGDLKIQNSNFNKPPSRVWADIGLLVMDCPPWTVRVRYTVYSVLGWRFLTSTLVVPGSYVSVTLWLSLTALRVNSVTDPWSSTTSVTKEHIPQSYDTADYHLDLSYTETTENLKIRMKFSA